MFLKFYSKSWFYVYLMRKLSVCYRRACCSFALSIFLAFIAHLWYMNTIYEDILVLISVSLTPEFLCWHNFSWFFIFLFLYILIFVRTSCLFLTACNFILTSSVLMTALFVFSCIFCFSLLYLYSNREFASLISDLNSRRQRGKPEEIFIIFKGLFYRPIK